MFSDVSRPRARGLLVTPSSWVNACRDSPAARSHRRQALSEEFQQATTQH